MHIILQRVIYREDGVFGVLLDGSFPFALTLERPWLNNEPSVSCIPVGSYVCRRVQSPKFGNTFQVMDVPNRSEILFHKGNVDDDSRGCILVGEQFSVWPDGSASIANSGDGFAEFLKRNTGMDKFDLRIIGPMLV